MAEVNLQGEMTSTWTTLTPVTSPGHCTSLSKHSQDNTSLSKHSQDTNITQTVTEDNYPSTPSSLHEDFPGNSADPSAAITAIPCDFCEDAAEHTCVDCVYHYCQTCLARLHPNIGPFQHHAIIAASELKEQPCASNRSDHAMSISPVKNQGDSMYCFTCESNCCADVRRENIQENMKAKRESLVVEMEKVSAAVYRLDSVCQTLKQEMDQLWMDSILKTEQLQHEFASIFNLLIEKEAELLAALEEEVARRRTFLVEEDTKFKDILYQEGQLVNEVTDLVQLPRSTFLKKEEELKHRCTLLMDQVAKFSYTSRTQDQYPLLCRPFSMYMEKEHLKKTLSLQAKVNEVEFKQTSLMLRARDLNRPISIAQFVNLPSAPLSTKMLYEVELKLGVKHSLSKKKTSNLKKLGSLISLVPCRCYILTIRQKNITAMSCTKKIGFWTEPKSLFIFT